MRRPVRLVDPTIAAYAPGARRLLYLSASTRSRSAVQRAIDQARAHGFLGQDS